MKLNVRFATLTVALCLCGYVAAYASEDAYLYLVHGVPGRDVSTASEPTLPVDILVNDESCLLHGFAFGSINGPLSLAPGQYDIKVSAANTLAPCTNPPLIDSTVELGSGEDASAVVALNDAGIPILSTFTNNLQPVATGQARLSIDYAGENSPIQVVVKEVTSTKSQTYTIDPGGKLVITVPFGNYTVEAAVGNAVLANQTIFLPSRSATLLFAVGDTANQSLSFVEKQIKDVF